MKGEDVDNGDPTHEPNLIPTHNRCWKELHIASPKPQEAVLDFTVSTGTNVAEIRDSLY